MNSILAVSTDFFGRSPEYPGSQSLLVPSGRALLFTQGMTARAENGARFAPDDVVAQTRRIILQIEALVGEVGGTLGDVVYMNVFLKKMDDAHAVQRVRNEFWNLPAPVSSTIEVSKLVTEDACVEIHAICAVPEPNESKSEKNRDD